MARLKPQVGKIETLDEANMVLKEIGLLERELEAIDSDAHRQIADIKTKAAKGGEALRKRIAADSALLGAYAEYNRGDLFKDRKSVQLSFGEIGREQWSDLFTGRRWASRTSGNAAGSDSASGSAWRCGTG